ALGRQRNHGRGAAGRFTTANFVQVVEGHVPTAHHARVHLGVLAQRRAAANHRAVELECAVRCEATSPTVSILRIDGMAVAGAKLLDGELLNPFVLHGMTSSAVVLCLASGRKPRKWKPSPRS